MRSRKENLITSLRLKMKEFTKKEKDIRKIEPN